VPGHQLAVAIDAAAQEVEAAGAEVVVLQVVLARPGQLDRRIHLARDRRRLDDEVGRQAPPETAAAAVMCSRSSLSGYRR
jgi:hypothetical protein